VWFTLLIQGALHTVSVAALFEGMYERMHQSHTHLQYVLFRIGEG
jgi:hypothetical protein